MKRSMTIGEWWKKFLRAMKKANLKVEDMPPEVAESALKIHQAALLEEKRKREQGRK